MPVDEDGNWYALRAPTVRKPKDARRKTLAEYQKQYDFEKGRHHPWVMYLRAIPMGDKGQVPMNHSLEVLNNMAIHLERIGFTEPDPKLCQIKYRKAEAGPDVVWNPGTWVDIDTEVPAHLQDGAPPPKVDLSGVPPEQLRILEEAIKAEKVRVAKIAGADVLTQQSMDVVPTKSLVEAVQETETADAPEEATE